MVTSSLNVLCATAVMVLSEFRCRAWRPAVRSAIVKRDFIRFLMPKSDSA